MRFTLLCLLLLAAQLPGRHAVAQPSRWTAEAWQQDLEFLRVRVWGSHGNPIHKLGHADLQEGFASLHDNIPFMTDFEIAFAMQRLLASLGDGHSWLTFHGQNLSRYFLFDAFEFSDGLYITHAGQGNDQAVGARIVAVDGMPIDDVRAALAPYISRDNDMDLLRQVPLLLRQPPALHAAGITRDRDTARFTLESKGGERTVEFRGVPTATYQAWQRRLPDPENPPLYLRDRESFFWYTDLPGENAVYFQFNRVKDMPRQQFAPFVDELFGHLRSQDIGCLIIDLRHNAGGRTSLLDPLLDALRNHPRFGREGHLYVITGRNTFSAALQLVVRLERETGVLFAGEPGTGKPNSYSEYGPYVLPNTVLRGSLSALYHQESEPLDPRTRVEVDLPAPLSYEDYQNKRDPALERILEHWRSHQN